MMAYELWEANGIFYIDIGASADGIVSCIDISNNYILGNYGFRNDENNFMLNFIGYLNRDFIDLIMKKEIEELLES